MTKYFFVLWSILFHFDCFSQVVNIENRRIYDDTSGFSGAVDAAFSAVQNKNLDFMKKLIYSIIGLFIFTTSFAQQPKLFSYCSISLFNLSIC